MTDEVQVRVTADTQDAEAGMKRAGEAVHESTEHMKESFEGVSGAFDELKDKFSTALEITGIALALEALEKLKEVIGEIAENALHLEHTAELLGINTTEMQGLHAAANEAGISTQTFDNSMTMLSLRMQQARDGSQAMRDKLEAVGITMANLEDPTFTAASAAYALAESHATNAEKMDVVGRRGIALLQTMRELEGGQHSANEKARETGALTEEQIATLANYHKAIATATEQRENFRARGLAGVAPALGDLTLRLTEFFGIVRSSGEVTDEFADKMRGIESEILKWAAAMRQLWLDVSSAFAGMGASIGNVAAAANAALHGRFDEAKSIWNEGTKDLLDIQNKYDADTIANEKALADGLRGIDNSQLQEAKTHQKLIPTEDNAITDMVSKGKSLEDQIMKESYATQNMMDKHHFAYAGMKEDLKLFDNAAKDFFKEEERRLKDSDKLNQYHAEQYYKSLTEMTKGFQTALSPIGNAFQTSINGMIQGTQTFAHAFGKMGQAILGDFISLTVHMAEKWAAKELAQTAMTQEHSFLRAALVKLGLIEEVASQGTATAATVATKGIEADAVVTANASEAASGAAASVASIPYVGWAMAAGVFAATLSMVLSAKHSAAGGFDVPSGVNPVTQLHSEEMVLPAPIANTVREAMGNHGTGGASRSGGGSFNLNTTGSGDYFMVHRRDLLNAFRKMQRDGLVPA